MDVPSIAEYLVARLTARARRRAERTRTIDGAPVPRSRWNGIARGLLQVGGLSAMTYAAFIYSQIAGLIVLGVACFVLSWLLSDSDQ